MSILTRLLPVRRATAPPTRSGRHLYAVGPYGIDPIVLTGKSTGNPLLDAFHGLTSGDEFDFPDSAEGWARAFHANAWAFRCIKMRAQVIAGIPLRVTTLDDEEVPNHPLSQMIGPANTRLMYTTEHDSGVFGRAFWSISRDSVKRINPQTIEVIAGESGLAGYVQKLGGQVVAQWQPHEMVYFNDYDPADDFGSISPLSRALRSVSVVENIGLFAEYYFKNGAMPSGILVSETRLNDSDKQRIKAEWNKEYSGVDKAHRTALLDGGTITYVPITPPLKDLSMRELREEDRREIAGALFVPPVMAGISDAANYATAQEQRKSMYTEWALPTLDLYVDDMNRQLVPYFGVDNVKVAPDLDQIEVLQEDRTEISTRNQIGVAAGYMSLNEARERENLKPLPQDVFVIAGKPVLRNALEAGDLSAFDPAPAASPFPFSFPANALQSREEPRQLPSGEAGKAVQVIVYSGPHKSEAEVIEGALVNGALTDLDRWRRKAAKKGASAPFESDYIPSAVSDFLRNDLLAWDGDADREAWVKRAFDLAEAQIKAEDDDLATPEEFEAYWRGIGELFDGIAAVFAESWEPLPERMAGSMRESSTLGAEFNLAGFLASTEDDIVDVLVGTPDMPGPLTAVFLAGAARGNDLLLNAKSVKQELAIAWDVINQMAVDWAREYGYTMVRGINDTTARVFAEKIAAWIEKGGSLDDLATYIEKGLTGLDVPEGWSPGKLEWATSPGRARLIAQTETTRAYFEGSAARWDQVGVKNGRWRTNQDAIVCDTCRPLNNVVGPITQGWTSPRDGNVYRPPAHGGCRCFAAPMVE